MRAVVQRVSEASVTVDGDTVGSIGCGLLVLLGVVDGDSRRDIDAMVDKIAGLRIFPDDEGKMNRSAIDEAASILLVSQFTLAADVRRGRRPSFTAAARPEIAEPLIEHAIEQLSATGLRVESGRFRANMAVSLVNDGPVTIVIDVEDGAVR